MPTYKNETNGRITWSQKNYIYWMPGEERALPYWVPHEMLGLTLISDLPKATPEISALGYWEVSLTSGEEFKLDLPYYEEFELSISMRKGSCEFTIGDGEAIVVVDMDNNHLSKYAWDMTPFMNFVGTNSAESVVIIKQEVIRPLGRVLK